MKRVLVVHYSQSGQLTEILESLLRPLQESRGVEIVRESLRPLSPYPFPWPFYRFLDVFPESVLMEPPELGPLRFDPKAKFDLVILGYTVWYLAPSLPTTAFLRSRAAEVMRDVPVITVVNARDKWLSAQERVRAELDRLGARLVDNIALIHQGNAAQHLVTTLRWMWTGKKDPFWRVFPPAGVAASEIREAARFGGVIRDALVSGEISKGSSILRRLDPAKVEEDIAIQEALALPNFVFWAKRIRAAGAPGSLRRAPLLLLFSIYLGALLAAAAPVMIVYKLLLRPFVRSRTRALMARYEQPSSSTIEEV